MTMKPGDIVYTADGRECQLVSVEDDGYVIRPVIECGPSEIDLGDPEIHRKVYAEEPSERIGKLTQEAQDKLQAVTQQLRDTEAKLREVVTQRDRTLAELAKQPDLMPVIEFLEGRITHVASIPSYGAITMKPIGEAVLPEKYEDRRDGEIRLLALYGGYTGPDGKSNYREDFSWRLNRYRDGSGDNVICFLGTSEQQARERLQVYLDKRLKKRGDHRTYDLAKKAFDAGLVVPEDLKKQIEQRQADDRARALLSAKEAEVKAAQALEDARRKLADMTERATP